MVLEPLNTCNLAGIDVVSARKDQVLDHLLARNILRKQTLVSFFNSNFFVQSFRNQLNFNSRDDFLFLNDGLAANLASRIYSGTSFADNLNGTDLIPSLLRRLPAGTRIFLFGARPEVVAKTAERVEQDYDVTVCGYLDGYGIGGKEAADYIAKRQPDVVLVALGNPLQEKWMAEFGKLTGASLTFGVGALFDFMSGETPRAPELIRTLRLEWLFRMAREPRRLTKRYTVEMGYFFWLILSFRAFGGSGPGGQIIRGVRELR